MDQAKINKITRLEEEIRNLTREEKNDAEVAKEYLTRSQNFRLKLDKLWEELYRETHSS